MAERGDPPIAGDGPHSYRTIYQDLLVWDNTDCSGTYGALSVIPSLDTSIATSIPGSANSTEMLNDHFIQVRTDTSSIINGNTRKTTPEHGLCENITCTYQTDCTSDSSSIDATVLCFHEIYEMENPYHLQCGTICKSSPCLWLRGPNDGLVNRRGYSHLLLQESGLSQYLTTIKEAPTSIDQTRRCVRLSNGSSIGYDYLCITHEFQFTLNGLPIPKNVQTFPTYTVNPSQLENVWDAAYEFRRSEDPDGKIFV
ncbi:hypothetical protein SeLEV6574_g07364 [Synchytrium endobioticum]|uniref:Uncharacterized protein n=1 Tax=Synchytrium endobioticum TaxID=286115 RepID=A0A507CLQ9_9FUNG|nr:hypothetical protein SeLEV6574_g07364 [Synchytrium endobioticum]